ncbi:MAG: hypothetical protein CVV48_13400 [Spirochaetae bacterium HGW-Spirochaetae-4]|jgi:predicted small secreted protein|nr:MAG: hypothetical protein CVV48_13400 [Spirochaetae bacterium HGW-Spirochaetae-4]
MKRKFKHMVIPVLLVLATLLIVGCNTENEGIFMRISESVEKVDVGSINLIANETGKIYSYASKAGLQAYDPATKNWESIPGAGVRHYTFDGTNIVYATEATFPDNNTLYTYDINTKVHTTWVIEHAVKAMSPKFNLILVRDDTNEFSVYSATGPAIGASLANFTSEFVDDFPPNLVAFDDSTFLVSGNSPGDTTKYSHYYVSEGAPMTSTTDATFYDNPLVAVGTDGTNIVAIDATGKVWQAATTDLTAFTSTTSITGFPERNPKNLPYPVFYHDSSLYLQNGDNDFYAVNVTSGAVSEVTLDFADTFSNIKIKSYLVDPLDSNKIYVGTMENGIYEITMPAGTATDI